MGRCNAPSCWIFAPLEICSVALSYDKAVHVHVSAVLGNTLGRGRGRVCLSAYLPPKVCVWERGREGGEREWEREKKREGKREREGERRE